MLWPATFSTLSFVIDSTFFSAVSSLLQISSFFCPKVIFSFSPSIDLFTWTFSNLLLFFSIGAVRWADLASLAEAKRFSMFSFVGEGDFQPSRRACTAGFVGEAGWERYGK